MIKAFVEFKRWLDRNNIPEKNVKVVIEVFSEEDLYRLNHANIMDSTIYTYAGLLQANSIAGLPMEMKVTNRRKGDRRK